MEATAGQIILLVRYNFCFESSKWRKWQNSVSPENFHMLFRLKLMSHNDNNNYYSYTYIHNNNIITTIMMIIP